MKFRGIFLLILICICMAVLTGCFKKNVEPVVPEPSGEEVEIKEEAKEDNPFDYEIIYGNGTGIVNYKDEVYFVEYGNSDYVTETLGYRYPFWNVSNSQRYINKIDNRGNIKNLFRITASTKFWIVDDRFYFQTINNQLYTVNMQGENSVELAKGDYIAFDVAGHGVYYQNEENPNQLYRIDTTTLTIEKFDFTNPTMLNNYNALTSINGVIYYSLFDEKNNELLLVEHNVKNNETKEVAKIKVSDKSDVERRVIDFKSIGNYGSVCLGSFNDGSLGGYYDIVYFVLDYENKKIEKTFEPPASYYEGGPIFDDTILATMENDLYERNFNKKLENIEKIILSTSDRDSFARKYNIDLQATLGDEAVDSTSFSVDSSKYIVTLEDYNIVGNKVMYKVTASRANPQGEIGWRNSYIRMTIMKNKSKKLRKMLKNNCQKNFLQSLKNKDNKMRR